MEARGLAVDVARIGHIRSVWKVELTEFAHGPDLE